MGSDVSKLQYENGNGQENTFRHNCDINFDENDQNVTFYYTDDLIIKVNKKKLLGKSAYFRSILKTCYKDQRSDFIDTSFPESYQVFKNVMNFVNTGNITLDINNVLEIWRLATFLQMDCLLEICLEHFTLNLNRKTLESQLDFMKNCPYLDREFRERALIFEKSGSPAFSGLYFLQSRYKKGKVVGKNLKQFSQQSVYELAQLKEAMHYSLHFFDNRLCTPVRIRSQLFLLQYNLVSGHINTCELKHYCFDREDVAISSAKNKLFVISKAKDHLNETIFSLSAFNRACFKEDLKVNKRINFKKRSQGNHHDNSKLWFSHCYGEKLYVFYSYNGNPSTSSTYLLDEMYLLIVCVQSLKVLYRDKLFSERFIQNNKIQVISFEMMFFHQKQEKLFIKTPEASFYDENPWKNVLVFDMKNNVFYFVANFLPFNVSSSLNLKFTSKNDTVYGIRQLKLRSTLFNKTKYSTEILTFHIENNKLVEDGVKYQNALQEITSACIV